MLMRLPQRVHSSGSTWWTLAISRAHVGEATPFEDKKAIEDVASHLVRAPLPLSLKKLVYLDGQEAVLYRSRISHWAAQGIL